MIIATVITCPQRWPEYQRLRRNFSALGFPFPLRTFQTQECLDQPLINNNLNSRAALQYCETHLPEGPESWVLYLEDDVLLSRELPKLIPHLVKRGVEDSVDCWFLCNRKNAILEQYTAGKLIINRLAFPPAGGHGLLLPKRHLRAILDARWRGTSDSSIFAAINHADLNILQVLRPVLVEHLGEFSTYAPERKQPLEINYAN